MGDRGAAGQKKRRVDKRGAKSDEAYVREVLGEMAGARNLLVINDEAHHAWRVARRARRCAGVSKAERRGGDKWVGGLDRIHRARGILAGYDFSATPFAPSGKKSAEEALFGWIVSDFGLNDAIEAGLVKTPRVVVRDDGVPDAKTYRSKLYHIYTDDVAGRPQPQGRAARAAARPRDERLLPARQDWLETAKRVGAQGAATPPVMITVANRTETAARIKYAFDHRQHPHRRAVRARATLHIDSKVLGEGRGAGGAPGRGQAAVEATDEDEDERRRGGAGRASSPRSSRRSLAGRWTPSVSPASRASRSRT